MSAPQQVSSHQCYTNGAEIDSVQPMKARSRKRNGESAALDRSPESVGDEDDRDGGRIGVKRACNECRQQKVLISVLLEDIKEY